MAMGLKTGGTTCCKLGENITIPDQVAKSMDLTDILLLENSGDLGLSPFFAA
ncbi:MAG: hypothetical protein ACRD4P_11595 [Bryobacteraceae bacterium]